MNACIIAYTIFEEDFRVSRYADALALAGYHVDVFSLGRKGDPRCVRRGNVTIHHLQERDFKEKGAGSFLVRMLAFFVRVFIAVSTMQLRYRYQIVHVHNPPDFMVFSAVTAKLCGAAIIFDMHENLPEFYCAKFGKSNRSLLVKLLLLCEKISIRYADFAIIAHDLLRKRVMQRDHLADHRCLALLNYPSARHFHPGHGAGPNGHFKIVYPGTISHVHGVDIAIKAMALVKSQCPSITLDIYGRCSDQRYFHYLHELIHGLDIKESVTIHPSVPFEAVTRLLQTSHLGIVPKRGGIFGSEAFSTKILEFMAAGLPVLVSKTKIDEYYFNDSTVMFFEPDNHRDMARCILELYRNKARREALMQEGRRYVAKNTWEYKQRLYLETVDNLVPGLGPGAGEAVTS